MNEQTLIDWFSTQGRAAIAFSGGVDSTFLLACAQKALNENVKAYTCQSAFVPDWELNEARDFCKAHRIAMEVIPLDILADAKIAQNPIDRCYLCKKRVFGAIVQKAADEGFTVVCDGTNVDDAGDFRPGTRAAKELGVVSPLQLLGYDKQAIRRASASMGLPTAQKPAYACLATRIPTDHPIKKEALERIDKAEQVFHTLGYPAVRVRCHDDLARIELAQDQLAVFLRSEDLSEVSRQVKQAGFRYVSLDLEGYKTGNMNVGKERLL